MPPELRRPRGDKQHRNLARGQKPVGQVKHWSASVVRWRWRRRREQHNSPAVAAAPSLLKLAWRHPHKLVVFWVVVVRDARPLIVGMGH